MSPRDLGLQKETFTEEKDEKAQSSTEISKKVSPRNLGVLSTMDIDRLSKTF